MRARRKENRFVHGIVVGGHRFKVLGIEGGKNALEQSIKVQGILDKNAEVFLNIGVRITGSAIRHFTK